MYILAKFRNTIMFFLKLSVLAVLTTAFLGVWQTYYREAMFGNLGDFVVIGGYLIVLTTFAQIYDGFKVGIMRLHELVYSLSLSAFFANTAIYVVLCLIARKVLNPIALITLFVSQIFILITLMYSLSKVYFTLYKARSVLAIFSLENRNDIIKKISIIKERFVLAKGITSDKDIAEIKSEIDRYETILICDFNAELKAEILKYCYACNKRIYMLPSSSDTIINGSYQVQVFDTPVLFLHNGGLSMEQRIIKRTLDIIISSLGIILLSPIMLIVAIAIKLSDGGPIIFKQERITRNQKTFNIYKFRSMKVNDGSEIKKTTVNDDRITPVGKLIRPLRIDELPQLFNILFGDMSIVGPRPEMTELVEDYCAKLPEFNLRHKVKAGLTGYAQLYGKYNTTPQNKLNMDIHYIENYSILEDIKLIALTIKILFVRESTEGFKETDSKLSNTNNNE